MTLIIKPGLYTDAAIRAAYHDDPCPEPSLSRSVAKVILERTPGHAKAIHPRLNPQAEEEEAEKFDLGTAAHAILLKAGSEIAVIDAKDWKKDATKLARDIARGEGKVPLLKHQANRAYEMAAAVRAQLPNFDETANILDDGESEVVGAWVDPIAGWSRIMVDRLLPDLTMWDIKTTAKPLSVENLSRLMSGGGMEWTHAWYERGIAALFPDMKGRVKYNFLFIENREPFAIMPARLSNSAIAKGRANVDLACRAWARAKASDNWPMFHGATETIEYPPWAVAEWMGDEE